MTLSFTPLRGILVFLLLSSFCAEPNGVDISSGTRDYATTLFGELAVDFDSDEVGCADPAGPVDVYTWRLVGYGSNINVMMLPWVNAILNGRKDLALLLVNDRWPNAQREAFDQVQCLEESNGVEAIGGITCLFTPMPHVCIFRTLKDWESFMDRRNLPTAEKESALRRRDVKSDREMIAAIGDGLQGSGMDILGAKAAVLKYLHSHLQPWIMRDVQSILDEPAIATLRDGPYVSIHVRRGDKLIKEAKAHQVQEYLGMASAYIYNSTEATTSVNDVKGIWVSSDDEESVSAIKQSLLDYFPNVQPENVVWVSGRAFQTTAASEGALPTMANVMEYRSYVILLAELEMMSQANVFVGTFTSNVARLIMLMREAKGMQRSSTLSVDRPKWFPARRNLMIG